MHASSFYGHENSVKLLLQFGASNAIKNNYGNFPLNEAASDEIKDIILSMNNDKISSILKEAIENKVGFTITPLLSNKKIIGKRIIRSFEGKTV